MPEDTVICLTVVATPQDVLEAHLNHLSKKSVGETLASEQTRRDVQEARGLIGSAHKLYRGALAFYLRGRDLRSSTPAACNWSTSCSTPACSRCARKTKWRRSTATCAGCRACSTRPPTSASGTRN